MGLLVAVFILIGDLLWNRMKSKIWPSHSSVFPGICSIFFWVCHVSFLSLPWSFNQMALVFLVRALFPLSSPPHSPCPRILVAWLSQSLEMYALKHLKECPCKQNSLQKKICNHLPKLKRCSFHGFVVFYQSLAHSQQDKVGKKDMYEQEICAILKVSWRCLPFTLKQRLCCQSFINFL